MNNPVTLTDPSGFAPDGELTWNEEEGERQAGAGGPSGPSGWGWGEGINGNGGAGVGVGDGYTSGGSPVDVIHPGPGPIGAGGGSGGDTGGHPAAGGTPSSDDDNATAPTTSGSGGGATGDLSQWPTFRDPGFASSAWFAWSDFWNSFGWGVTHGAEAATSPIFHPVQTAEGLASAVRHPIQAATTVGQMVGGLLGAIGSGDPSQMGDALGNLATFLVPAGVTRFAGVAGGSV